MDKRVEENKRVKKQICAAFFGLLRQSDADDVDSISISQITSRANVSRMAYYRNFKSKNAIVKYYIDEVMWSDITDELGDDIDFWTNEYGQVFFSTMKKHRDTILLLESHGYSSVLLSSFNHHNEEIAGDMPSNSIERYKLYYAAGASMNAVLVWLQSGCKESVESMVDSFSDFCRYLHG